MKDSERMQQVSHFSEFVDKMRKAKASDAAIRAFEHNYCSLIAGKTGLIPEAGIQSVTTLPRFEELAVDSNSAQSLLSQTVILKLNGGLGTSMGLEKAKSLLPIKNGQTFLDFIARQILFLRDKYESPLPFLLMNSFSTSEDTLTFLKKYPQLGESKSLELMQNFVPKVDAATLRPISWPAEPDLEWCPPGHGDLYPALLGSGLLDRLLEQGVKFMFVSNSDNLGASLELKLLTYFAESNKPFLMEVCERTAADKKGGHLAQRNGKLLLRESAQCPAEDIDAFQDIQKHRFFNTNNLWVRLDKLKTLLNASGGFIPLPMIKNVKTVDPRDKKSPQVIQLETAMGAAIECFDDAGAIVVPRTRFAPVKTTSDLLTLRSDAYDVTEDSRLVLASVCGEQPPAVDLDGDHYKLVDQLDEKLKGGVPSLKECRKLSVRGAVAFQTGNIFKGEAQVCNPAAQVKSLAPGTYTGTITV
jgi:UDP-N-acetylglucosamine pyrophosphorylase